MANSSLAARAAALTRLSNARSLLPPLKASSHPFISPEQFNLEHLQTKRPGLFPRLVSDAQSPYRWPACSKWGPANDDDKQGPLQGLRDIEALQRSLVDVEISLLGRGYGDKGNDEKWFQTKMPFMMFHDAFVDDKIPFNEKDPSKQRVGYVAQQDLFDNVPQLHADCPPLPHSSAGQRGDREQWRRNIWIGGGGTFTPIHRDPYENLFVQVVGTKRIHIFPPSVAEHLRLFSNGTLSNTSSLPTEEVLLDIDSDQANTQTINFSAQPLLSNSSHALLCPGDVLYVPQGWFHCVASLSVSASVNAWFR